MVCAQLNPVMFHARSLIDTCPRGDLAILLDRLAKASTRPRYAFMLLNLIAEAARPDGSAGPFVAHNGSFTCLRDWLCDALTPMGGRDHKRVALAARIRHELEQQGQLPANAVEAAAIIEEQARTHVRASGKTNLSRAVSELVGAGLLNRHYQGYRIDHHHRGGQRHAVYSLAGAARCLLRQPGPAAPPRPQRQGELAF